jgi:FixJ family two-component response regulator
MNGMPTIAIIDDDASVRNAAGALLRSLGYVTAKYGSAEEFLDSGRVTDTACILTDVKMPGMGGIELQDHLMAQGRKLPIIFMTAFPEEHARSRALAAGARGFLVKQFAEKSLIDCITSALKT